MNTYKRYSKKRLFYWRRLYSFILPLLMLTSFVQQSYAQTKVLADEVTYTSGNKPGLINPPPTVQSPNNALGDNNNYATLLSSPGTALNIGNYDGVIELKFAIERPANSWSYVRIGNEDKGLLDALLGGSLGEVLKDVVGVIAGGSQYFSVQPRNGTSNAGPSRTSNQGFNTDRFKLIQDAVGNIYLAVRPEVTYDRIRITNSATFSVLGLGNEFKLHIYNAFYYEDDNGDCGRPQFTSFDGSGGISLDVVPVDNQTLGNAIDNDSDSFSLLKSSSVLNLSVAGSLSQHFYFPTKSDETATLNLKIALGTGNLLDIRALSAVEIIFRNNGAAIARRSLSSGLLNGTDALGLLQSGDPVTLTFGIGHEFDQVEVRLNALLDVGVGASDVKIYDVQRYDGTTCLNPNIEIPDPTDPMLSESSCGGEVISFDHANFPSNAVDGNNDTFTTLEASSGIAAGIGAYDGHVEIAFDNMVPAGQTTYVRIDFDEEALLGLLDGSLGQFAGDLVDNILFGGHYFSVEGKNGGTTVFSRTSRNGFSNAGQTGNGVARIVQDKNGHYYISITPEAAINSVRITESVSSLLGLGTVKTMNVYHACYSTGSGECEQGFATFSESSGITLDLLGLGAAGVTDAENAIDGDINTASKVSVGAVGVSGSMMQHVQFHGLSSDHDHFRVKMKMNTNGVVDVDVLGSIIVKAYNGDQEVYSQRLNEQLIPGLDLLNLLSTGQMINLPFSPGEEFDRVAVGIASLVAANVISVPLEIYSVERFSNSGNCTDPELEWDPKTTPPFNTPDCVNELGSFENVNFPYEAVTDNPNEDTYATLTAGAGVAGGLGAYSSHIELKYSGVGAAGHEVSYIRVDSEGNLFDALLGGSLGDALGGLLGSVALGNQYIVIQAQDASGNPVGAQHSSVTGFDTEFVKLVKDKDGRYYLAVTAPDAYQSVRIEYHHTALVGAMGSSSMNVYSMCRETEFDLCEQATFTSWDGDGIALDILDLTNGGVANPEFAIDDNNSNYSTLNLGVAGAAASVSQKLYFKTKSNIADELRVRLQLAQPGILNVDLFGNSKLIFYDGEVNVKEMTLESGLINNLDLLGLFNSGGVQSFTFAPGVVYDRVELKISSLVAVGTSAPVRLYGMSRLSADCPDPDFLSPNDVFKSPVCADGVEIDNVRAVDDVDFAIDGDYNSYATMRADAGTIFGIGNEESILELKFGSTVDANTTSYLRIADDAGLLESLLSGSIGEAVYGLLNNVALGDNYFVVRAKDGANTVLEGSSRDGFADANGLMKIVQDKAGRYYVAISPDVDYTSVEIKAFSEAIVGITAEGYNLHVYGMCYETDFSGCEEGFSTSWDGSGLSVGITGVGSYGVTDAFKALNDNNNSDYSTLSLGTLNVAGHIQQNIQYNKPIPANTSIRLKMGVGTGTVNAAVFDDIRIVGYRSGVEVYNQQLQTAVLGGVSLGTLFNNGGEHDVSFAMDEDVDEIALRLNSLVNATVGVPDVRLYYIVQDCEEPEFVSWKSFEIDGDASIETVKGGEEIEYTIHIRNTGSTNIVGATVEDVIPDNTTFVSAANGGVNTGGTVTFENIDVAVGTTETVSFIVKVNEDLTQVTEITNVALVKLDENDTGTETYPPSETDPNEPDDSGNTGTIIPVDQVKSVVSWKAYTIDADDKTSTTVSGGEEVTYHIYVRNTGNQDLTDVEITDVLPDGVIWKTGGTHNAGVVSFTINELAVGATSSALNFTVTVDKDLTDITEISNIAVVKPDANEPDELESFPPTDNTNPIEPDETSTPGTVLEVIPNHDVEISKTGISNNATTNAQAQIGDEITYTITVKNTGNKSLPNVIVEDEIPANLTIIDDGGATTVNGNSLTFDIANLEVEEEVVFTIIAEVDHLDGGITEIENTATVTYRNEDNTGDKTEEATHIMPTSCTPIIANQIVLDPDELTVCAEDEFTIIASTTLTGLTDPVYKWYTNAALTGTPFIGDTLITSVTETTTFYVTLEADGYCFTTPAQEITITIEPEAGTPTITSNGATTGICLGETVELIATATGADSYQWYKDGVEITGVNAATYDAIETGSYTVTALNATGCDSDPSAAVEITFLPTAVAADIEIDAPTSVCENTEVSFKASLSATAQTIDNPVFKWYLDVDLTELVHEGEEFDVVASAELVETHTLYVTVEGDGVCANTGDVAMHTITVNPAPKLTIDGSTIIYVATGAAINWPTVTAEDGNGTSVFVEWYDSNQNIITGSLPTSFAAVGSHTYYVVAEDAGCMSYETIIVNVYDADACPPTMERVYATDRSSWGSIITGGVSNQNNAVDGNPKTYSTITTGVGLLGIGTTWQNIYFDHEVPAGTPVTIKLGKEYSGLMLAGGLSVQGLDHNGNTIGGLKTVAGGLLDLLVADNVVEFTFVPSTNSGPKAYHGVRISQGALVSVAQNAKVYGAYYTKEGAPDCSPIDNDTNPNVLDVLHGVKDLGLGVASATASVVDPWNAVDGNLSTSATLVRGVAVANAATLTVVFKQAVQPTDELQIVMEDITNHGLNLNLLTGFRFQRYMGETPVGDPIQGGDVLNLKLLYFPNGQQSIIVDSYNEPYDRIQIALGSIVQAALSDQVEIFDISVLPKVEDEDENEEFTVCPGEELIIKEQDECTIYAIYDDGDNLLETQDGLNFTVPRSVAPGTYTYYVQAIRQGCEIGPRQEIEVTVLPSPEVLGYEVSKNGDAPSTYNPNDFEIDVSPSDKVLITPNISWNGGNRDTILWEVQNPEDSSEWMPIDFGQTDVEGNLELEIPDYGEVLLPDGSIIDIRNSQLVIRAVITADSGCQIISDDLLLNVDGKSALIVNPNIINKL